MGLKDHTRYTAEQSLNLIAQSTVKTMPKIARASKDELRDALAIAYTMLVIVQRGGSLTNDAWYERMQKIEAIIRKDNE